MPTGKSILVVEDEADLAELLRYNLERDGYSCRCVLDGWSTLGVRFERTAAARAGIDLRWPYRDRRLLQFVASLPAHLLFRPGQSKWILREAMRGALPETVRRRRWASSLGGLVARGVGEQERGKVLDILGTPGAPWPRFVRREWMEATLRSWMTSDQEGAGAVVPWQCLTLEVWLRRAGDTGVVANRESRN